MKTVKIHISNDEVSTSVRTQAESKGFVYVEYASGIMVFEKENDQIGSIYDLKLLPDIGPYITIE